MLDGLGKIPEYVSRGKKLGMQHMAQTNHGNIAGAPDFYKECKANGINPILGCEFYFVPDVTTVAEDMKRRRKESEHDDAEANRYHVVFLAKNEDGFKTLVDLNSESHRNYYYKPLIDRSMVEALGSESENLIVLSGCAGSILSRKALHASRDEALDEARWWSEQFESFYIELQHHNAPDDRKLNQRLVRIARDLALPHVITNDPHYVVAEQAEAHDCLLAVQTAADVDDPDRFRFEGEGFHLKGRKEMERTFRGYREDVWRPGLDNSLKIASEINITIPAWDTRTWHIPNLPGVTDPDTRVKELAVKELKRRGWDKKPEYAERLRYELPKVRKAKITGAMLITRDALRYAKRKGYRVGPGRGSVCGSLVGYLIGIHKIDPVKYDLLFERFLNPERPKMPDIDSDFERAHRDDVIEYSIRKFGADNVIRVAAFSTMQAKGAFQSLARAYGIDHIQRNRLTKEMLEDEEGNTVLPEEIRNNYPELVERMKQIEGLKKGISRHPAGIVILQPEDPIKELIPEMWIAGSKKMVGQYDLDTVSDLGLFKQDYLVIRALDTIEWTCRFVKERHGIDIDPDEWVPDEEKYDSRIYKMLAAGKTAGVFQMEGGTNHRGIQQIKPTKFEDIVSCTSLYRAGPLDAGADKRFLENRADGIVRVMHKSLEPILNTTWGEMIYQEQMFRILNEVAGFSWARVDDAKTAVSKKDPEKMAKLKDEAIAGFMRIGGMSESKAEEVWAMIAAQATYLFNRSHAVAYSMLSYQTARLKYLYPLEYLAALLATVEPKNKTDIAKRERYMSEVVLEGFRILAPDINKSAERFRPEGKDAVRFGFFDVSGIGEKTAPRLVAERPRGGYKKLAEVRAAGMNASAIQALSESGALEAIGMKTTKALQETRLKWQFEDKMLPIRQKFEKKVKLPTNKDGQVVIIGEIKKTEIRPTKRGTNFCTWVLQWAPGMEYKVNIWDSAFDLFEIPKGRVVQVSGKWQADWQNVSVGDSDQVRLVRA
jgi:DNA polymerase-3 subunit alpha